MANTKKEELLLGQATPATSANAATTAASKQQRITSASAKQTATTASTGTTGVNSVTGVNSNDISAGSAATVSPALINLPGVSEATKQTLGALASGYKPSAAVTQAMSELQSIIAQQPAAFQSQYTAQLNAIMNRILNREAFSYDPYSDPLYMAYRDNYIQQGKQAMQDTMGQAAMLTGGYGNSYASTAGNQAYQQYLTQLNNQLPTLQSMALDRYNAESDNLATQYSALNDAYSREYGEWTDAYNRWTDDRNYYAGRYDTERNFDYSGYTNNLSYWQNMAAMENDQYNADREFALAQEKWEWEKAQAEAAAASSGSSGGSSKKSGSSGGSSTNSNSSGATSGTKSASRTLDTMDYSGVLQATNANDQTANGYRAFDGSEYLGWSSAEERQAWVDYLNTANEKNKNLKK